MEDKNLALKCARLVKLYFPSLLLDSIGEALFEFELDDKNVPNRLDSSKTSFRDQRNSDSIESKSRVFNASATSA